MHVHNCNYFKTNKSSSWMRALLGGATIIILGANCDDIVTNTAAKQLNVVTENWNFHFPSGTAIGLLLAIALPLQNSHDTYLAYNFEAVYNVPDHIMEDEYPPIVHRMSKGFSRRFIYDAIESKVNIYGFQGKSCLLRMICEASEASLKNNGVVGDILHIIFTPSASSDNIASVYERAEDAGRHGRCRKYYKNCKFSFLNLISWIEEAIP